MTNPVPPHPGKASREARLASALRDNLKRRKAQSRERLSLEANRPAEDSEATVKSQSPPPKP